MFLERNKIGLQPVRRTAQELVTKQVQFNTGQVSVIVQYKESKNKQLLLIKIRLIVLPF